jgi:hypothetical protein
MFPENDKNKSIGITALNRRELMKRSLQLGAAAYVAPMILAHETPVGAQVSAACVGSVCGAFAACGGNENCICTSVADGSGFCVTNASCEGLTPCSLVAPCGPFFVCLVNTCCDTDGGVCVPPSYACNVAAAGPSVPVAGPTLGRR